MSKKASQLWRSLSRPKKKGNDDKRWGHKYSTNESNIPVTEYIDEVDDDHDHERSSNAHTTQDQTLQHNAPQKKNSKWHLFSLKSKKKESTDSRGKRASKISHISAHSSRHSEKSHYSTFSTRSTAKKPGRNSLADNNLPAEWGDMHNIFEGFDLQIWWRRASMPTRMNAVFVVLLLTFAVVHFLFACWFITEWFRETIKSPYVCETDECHKASKWMTSTMDTKKDPCDNFYEFMCGNYKKEVATEGNLLAHVIYYPGSKVELGANSMLAKILKNFKNDPKHDQSIRAYQACLNQPIRKQFGLTAFLETLENIFGTRDLSKFETTSLSMEEIGANMFRHIGEATYINMAFYTYPFILILRPSQKIHDIFVNDQGKGQNELLIQRLFDNLLPDAGVTDKKQLSDTYKGLEVISKIETLIYDNLASYEMEKNQHKIPPELITNVKTFLNGLCPPMGVQLNIREMLKLFIDDYFRLEFIDLMALKTFIAFETCLSEDPAKFTHFPVTYPKTSFIAPWIYGIFWNFLLSMDTKDLLAEWKISHKDLPHNELVLSKTQQANDQIELRCMLGVSKNLGYLNAIRFLLSTQDNPLEYLEDRRAYIHEQYLKTKKWFSKIPKSEIAPNQVVMGELVFSRNLHIDVLMPLVSGTLHESAITDELEFGDDHLRNSYLGIKYTVEKARQNWLGSTNTEPTYKWWAFGEPLDLQYELFDIRQPSIKAAEFLEVKSTKKNVKPKWYKFLKRIQPNYVLFLLDLFDEPYSEETLFMVSGGITYKMIRTVYEIFDDPFVNDRYLSLNYNGALFDFGKSNEKLPRKCTLMYSFLHPVEDETKPFEYKFVFDEKVTTGQYSWDLDQGYLSLLALKQALQMLKQNRKALSREPYNWTVPLKKRKLRMQRLFPGKILSKYTEEQLMFMTWVRNTCRGSWKTHEDLKEERFDLETTVIAILQQMEEFEKVWKCKKNSFMSNKGYPRCVQWVP